MAGWLAEVVWTFCDGSEHFYPVNTDVMELQCGEVVSAGKVFVVGEFGWTSGDVSGFLEAIETNAGVSVSCYWSLFPVSGRVVEVG